MKSANGVSTGRRLPVVRQSRVWIYDPQLGGAAVIYTHWPAGPGVTGQQQRPPPADRQRRRPPGPAQLHGPPVSDATVQRGVLLAGGQAPRD